MLPHRHKLLRAMAPFGGVMSCIYITTSASYLFHKCMQATRWSFGLIDGSWVIMLSYCTSSSHGFIHLWLMTRSQSKTLWSGLMPLITSICLCRRRLILTSHNSSLCCHWSTWMRKERTSGNGHLNMGILSQRFTMSLASPTWWLIPFSNGFGSVHLRSSSRCLDGFS